MVVITKNRKKKSKLLVTRKNNKKTIKKTSKKVIRKTVGGTRKGFNKRRVSKTSVKNTRTSKKKHVAKSTKKSRKLSSRKKRKHGKKVTKLRGKKKGGSRKKRTLKKIQKGGFGRGSSSFNGPRNTATSARVEWEQGRQNRAKIIDERYKAEQKYEKIQQDYDYHYYNPPRERRFNPRGVPSYQTEFEQWRRRLDNLQMRLVQTKQEIDRLRDEEYINEQEFERHQEVLRAAYIRRKDDEQRKRNRRAYPDEINHDRQRLVEEEPFDPNALRDRIISRKRMTAPRTFDRRTWHETSSGPRRRRPWHKTMA